MPKADIHPDYHKITVKLTNGETFETRSTWGSEGDTLSTDVDPHTHPAWTGGGAFYSDKSSQILKFKDRFAGFDIGGPADKKAEDKKED